MDFVKDKNIGRVCTNPEKLAAAVKELKNNRREFDRIKDNIKKVRRPDAALDIAKELLSYLKKDGQ